MDNDTMTSYVQCDVGNPFPAQHNTSFTIATNLKDIHKVDDTELVFACNVSSQYADDLDPSDNTYNCEYILCTFGYCSGNVLSFRYARFLEHTWP